MGCSQAQHQFCNPNQLRSCAVVRTAAACGMFHTVYIRLSTSCGCSSQGMQPIVAALLSLPSLWDLLSCSSLVCLLNPYEPSDLPAALDLVCLAKQQWLVAQQTLCTSDCCSCIGNLAIFVRLHVCGHGFDSIRACLQPTPNEAHSGWPALLVWGNSCVCYSALCLFAILSCGHLACRLQY